MTARRAVINDCWNTIGVRGDSSCPELKRYVHCRNCPVYSAAAMDLLDVDLPADHLSRWTHHVATESAPIERSTESVVVFRVGEEWLALASNIFKEIAAMRTIHAVPHRHDGAVLGVTNVRGQLLVCASLRHVLGLESGPLRNLTDRGAANERLLVIEREGSRTVFPVDEVHGILRFHAGECVDVPATVAKASGNYIRAVLPWQRKSVGIVDDQLLFYTLNRSLALATST